MEKEDKKPEVFIVFEPAKNARNELVTTAIQAYLKSRSKDKGVVVISGNEIQLPAAPYQTALSPIAKGRSDGSYFGFINEIKNLRVITASDLISANENNNPVDLGLNAKKATKEEVKKVLG